MALRTFAAQTFSAVAFAVVTLHGAGAVIPPATLSPVDTLILPSRAYQLIVPQRAFVVTLVARAPTLTLPARTFLLTLLPRGTPMALSLDKQPSETFVYTVAATQYLPPGRTIASVEAFASRKDTAVADALTGNALADATTIVLSNNPGKGARILINPDAATAELVKATAVSGANPCTVTVVPALMFNHLTGEVVSYEPGFSASVLVSTAPATTGTDFSPHVTRGIHGHIYRMSYLMILDNGNVIESESDLVVSDT